MVEITETQLERVEKVSSYLKSMGKVYFKSNLRAREKIGMNRGQLRDAVAILLKLGVLSRQGSLSNCTYKVDLDMLRGEV